MNLHELIDLHVDLDGVLANYDLGYRQLGGDPSEKGKDKARRFKNAPHFYRHLQLTHDAMELWNYVKQFDPSILSASSNFLPNSYQDKLDWVHEHLHMTGPKVVIVKMPNQKQKHCKPGSILIDDNTKNCAEWEQAGGIAIIHTSAHETIRQLKAIVAERLAAKTHHVHEAFRATDEAPATSNVAEAFDTLYKESLCGCRYPVPASTCQKCSGQ